MDASEEIQDRARGRRKPVAKAARGEDPQKRKKSLCLSPEEWERLGIHAVKTLRSESAIVGELIRTHLRRFVVSDRGGEPAASPADEAKDADATLPMGETLTPPGGESPAEMPGQGRGGGGGRRRTA